MKEVRSNASFDVTQKWKIKPENNVCFSLFVAASMFTLILFHQQQMRSKNVTKFCFLGSGKQNRSCVQRASSVFRTDVKGEQELKIFWGLFHSYRLEIPTSQHPLNAAQYTVQNLRGWNSSAGWERIRQIRQTKLLPSTVFIGLNYVWVGNLDLNCLCHQIWCFSLQSLCGFTVTHRNECRRVTVCGVKADHASKQQTKGSQTVAPEHTTAAAARPNKGNQSVTSGSFQTFGFLTLHFSAFSSSSFIKIRVTSLISRVETRNYS